MGKKRKKILDVIREADIRVSVPEKTEEINPVMSPVPGFKTEKTEAGVAKIGKRNALYLKLHLKGGD